MCKFQNIICPETALKNVKFTSENTNTFHVINKFKNVS